MTDAPSTTPSIGMPQRDSAGTLLSQLPPGSEPMSKTETEPKLSNETLLSQSPDPKTDPKLDAEGKTLLDDAKSSDVVPETYADFTLPEGFELPAEKKTEITALFKELGLSQDKAQKLVDYHTKEVKASTEAPATAFQELKQAWRGEAFKDSDIGTGTQIKPEVLSTIGRAIDGLGPLAPAFREAMNLTGVGDNPAFIKAFYQMAQASTEGRPVKAGGPSASGQANPSAKPATGAHALYPNLA